ncbi:MAG: Maf family protein [Deltaproteobacteria bacterium]|jgi:septum formation protein|nr:Maf family protein [Deltaproteobacteria bacterium]
MSVFTSYRPFILASGSPRRFELLAQAGLDFTVCKPPPDFVEKKPEPGEQALAYARRIAAAKAGAVFETLAGSACRASSTGARTPRAPVLAADTIVLLDGDVFGKPSDPEHAFAMLKRLSGRTHEVITACCLLLPQLRKKDVFALTSRVTFWNCPEELLRAYARSKEPPDKAGAYAIQGSGGFLVRSIKGSWSNVVGLPVSEVIEKLLLYGIIGVKNESS